MWESGQVYKKTILLFGTHNKFIQMVRLTITWRSISIQGNQVTFIIVWPKEAISVVILGYTKINGIEYCRHSCPGVDWQKRDCQFAPLVLKTAGGTFTWRWSLSQGHKKQSSSDLALFDTGLLCRKSHQRVKYTKGKKDTHHCIFNTFLVSYLFLMDILHVHINHIPVPDI